MGEAAGMKDHIGCDGCPFNFGTELTEQAQNYGCLPTPQEIMTMRTKHGKTWACHSDTNKPCKGALAYMQEKNLTNKVIDPQLVTEKSDWSIYL